MNRIAPLLPSLGTIMTTNQREKWERKSAIDLGLALIVIPLISLALWWAFLSVVWPVHLLLSE